MTIFEYLSIAASIVLALALGKLASAIPYVFAKRKFDAVYSVLFISLFLGAMLQWWVVWQLNEYQDWSFAGFMLLMASPIVLFVTTHVLVSESPAEVVSWQAYLSEIHRLFFALLLLGLLLAYARGYYFHGELPSLWAAIPFVAVVAGIVRNDRALLLAVGVIMVTGGILTGLTVKAD